MSTAAGDHTDTSNTVEVPISELRDKLAETLDRVDREDTFVYVTRNGRRVAALMPADVAENYERIEDDYWARRAAEARGEPTRSLNEVIADLEGSDR